MYVNIRRYERLDSIDEIVQRVEKGYVPIISEGRGFVTFYLVDAGNGTVASIGVFEDQSAAEESNKKAADWIMENIAPLIPNPPQITVGEVRIHKAA
jgi:hypothetical protein